MPAVMLGLEVKGDMGSRRLSGDSSPWLDLPSTTSWQFCLSLQEGPQV